MNIEDSTVLYQSPPAHRCRAVAPDSWWVYRHRLGADGQPLPWGRVVHYCRSEAEALGWIREQREQRPS
ncbi:MAG: hypothetical protein HWE39_12375 [Oceanospirillaceae bacterium]|nr:hypothetical protein [Oceanospirillaceae bacterium]